MYERAGRIAIVSENGCDVYTNTIYKLSSKTTSYKDTIFCFCVTSISYLFWCCVISTKIQQKIVCACWHMFNVFVPLCAVSLCTTHGQTKTYKVDIECFIPIETLKDLVGSSYLFIKSLIGSTGKIWSDVYTIAKCI